MGINYDVVLGYWELYLLILVRITSFVYTAPFFSIGNTPQRVKLGFSIFLSYLVFTANPFSIPVYETVVDYAVLIAKETVVGLTLGFCADICTQALHFAGHIIDVNVGLSMASMYDPVTRMQVNISGTFYYYSTFLLMLITGLYQFMISAIVDTYTIIPVAGANIDLSLYTSVIGFITEYFVIGFRIALPVFISIMLLNCILGILAKIAPQMNMFAVGMQLKLFAGLFVMFITVGLLPKVSTALLDTMRRVVIKVAEGLH